MNCKTCRIEIEEADGGQSISQSGKAHVESCPGCFAFLNEQLALRKMIRSLDVVTAPADFDFRLRARLAELKGQERDRVTWNRFAPGGWAMAIAAAFVILVAAGIIIRQSRRPQSTDAGPLPIVKVDSNNTPKTNTSTNSPESRETVTNGSVAEKAAGTESTGQKVTKRQETSANPDSSNSRKVANNVSADDDVRSVDSSVSSAANVLPLGISDPTLNRSRASSYGPFVARGMETQPITADVAARLNVRGGRRVVMVRPSSAAARAGVLAGDIIETVNGKLLSEDNLPTALPNTITVDVVRNGQKLTLQIEMDPISAPRTQP